MGWEILELAGWGLVVITVLFIAVAIFSSSILASIAFFIYCWLAFSVSRGIVLATLVFFQFFFFVGEAWDKGDGGQGGLSALAYQKLIIGVGSVRWEKIGRMGGWCWKAGWQFVFYKTAFIFYHFITF